MLALALGLSQWLAAGRPGENGTAGPCLSPLRRRSTRCRRRKRRL